MPQIHIEPTDPSAIRIRDAFFPGKDILLVPRVAAMLEGHCYGNVRRHIDGNGGSMQLGWLVSAWPGKFIEALHHAVWVSPDGILQDITNDSNYTAADKFSSFIKDDVTPIPDRPWYPAVPSKFITTTVSSNVKKYITATIAVMQLRADLSSKMKAAGEVPVELDTGENALELYEDTPAEIIALAKEIERQKAEKSRLRALIR